MKINCRTATLAALGALTLTTLTGGVAAAVGDDPSGSVLIVNGSALAAVDQSGAAAVAAKLNAALLLTGSTGLPATSLGALRDLNPARVIVVGGHSSVSSTAFKQIADAASEATVTRVGGANRYETAAQLAAMAAAEPLTAGVAGPEGPQGPAGPLGPSGPAGEQGPAGPGGPSGPAGPKGATGPSGTPGKDGLPGANGKDGTPGADGLNGTNGKDGAVVGTSMYVATTSLVGNGTVNVDGRLTVACSGEGDILIGGGYRTSKPDTQVRVTTSYPSPTLSYWAVDYKGLVLNEYFYAYAVCHKAAV